MLNLVVLLRVVVSLLLVLAIWPAVVRADVRALGPTTGPAGLVVSIAFPACPTQTGEWSRIRLANAPFGGVLYWGDQFPGGFWGAGTPGTLGNGPSTATLSTTDTWFGSPEFPVGTHNLRFTCEIYTHALGVRTLWDDTGFALTITAPSQVAPVDQTAVTPGMTIATTAGAPSGPTPCPSLPGVSWRRVVVYFYDGGSPYVLYGTTESATGAATKFHRTVSGSASPGGNQVAIGSRCEAGNASFEWRTARLDVVLPAASGATCSYGPRRSGDTNCDGRVQVVVMGDSYISGEGGATSAFPYLYGSDEHSGDDRDLCHRSGRSWAMQAARDMAPSAAILDPVGTGIPGGSTAIGDKIWFLACSGAVTADIDGATPQYAPEDRPQLDLLEAIPGDVDIVFLSIGGNDARFSDVITHCMVTECAADTAWQRSLLDNMQRVGDRVAEVAIKIRRAAPGAELYQLGYPDPIRPIVDPPCGSLGSVALGPALTAYVPKLGGGYTAVGPQSVGGIDAREQRWISDTYISRLNARVRGSATLSGAHFLDVSDLFRDRGICRSDPLAHGLTGGDDRSGIGNESFHPTPAGYDALFEAVKTEFGATFGANPNGPAAETPYGGRDFLEVRVVGPDPETDVFAASSGGYVIIRDGPKNSVIVAPTFSIGTVAGRAVTDDDGYAKIPIRIPASAGPGLHHIELMTEAGETLGSALFVVVVPKGCTGLPDIDGDALNDTCDTDPSDGPQADLDGDGVANATDACPLAPDAAQTDSDDDGRGDACDIDQGANPFGSRLRASLVPPPAVPAAPQSVQATALSATVARVSWAMPADDVPITGYRITTGDGQHRTVQAHARSVDVSGLTSGSVQRFVVRAASEAGLGTAAITDPITMSAVPQPTPIPTASPTPSPAPTVRPTSTPLPPPVRAVVRTLTRPPPGVAEPPPTVEPTVVRAIVSGSRTQKLGSSLFVIVACPDRACVASAAVSIRVPKVGRTPARTIRLTTAKRSIPRGTANKRKLAVRLRAKTVKQLRRALRARAQVRASFVIDLRDTSGATKTLRRTVKIKR